MQNGTPHLIEEIQAKLRHNNERLASHIDAWLSLLDCYGYAIAQLDSVSCKVRLNTAANEDIHSESDNLRLKNFKNIERDILYEDNFLKVWVPLALCSANRTEIIALTRREREVLMWLRDGKTSDETAVILGIARRTVESHRSRIYRKIGKKSAI